MMDTVILILSLLSFAAAAGALIAAIAMNGKLRAASEEKSELSRRLEEMNARQDLRARADREELNRSLQTLSATTSASVAESGRLFLQQSENLERRVQLLSHSNEERLEKLRLQMEQGLAQARKETGEQLEQMRLATEAQNDATARRVQELSRSNEERLEKLRLQVEQGLDRVRRENNEQLEQMRQTVDEKLATTLEKRLGESFKIVSDHLEQVTRGLGEMQALAGNVGDLKRVLQNVKTRGTWGEVQLGAILEQILTQEQYAANVAVRPRANDRVEYAIRLPGQQEGDKPVWLPIDSKFPQEDYIRLMDALDSADMAAAEAAGKALEQQLLTEGRTINEKYIAPPHSTDFAIMFLPSEGLYAEAIRRPGLSDKLQNQYRIVMAGPTTLAALVNSLQMGFRTLAVQKRSSEVWKLLGQVRLDFSKYNELLAKTLKQVQAVENTLETAQKRTSTIQRHLQKVELPETAEPGLLPEGDEEE